MSPATAVGLATAVGVAAATNAVINDMYPSTSSSGGHHSARLSSVPPMSGGSEFNKTNSNSNSNSNVSLTAAASSSLASTHSPVTMPSITSSLSGGGGAAVVPTQPVIATSTYQPNRCYLTYVAHAQPESMDSAMSDEPPLGSTQSPVNSSSNTNSAVVLRQRQTDSARNSIASNYNNNNNINQIINNNNNNNTSNNNTNTVNMANFNRSSVHLNSNTSGKS